MAHSDTRSETERFFKETGVSEMDVNMIANIDDAETLRACVAQGLGTSILSCGTAESLVQQGKISVCSPGDRELRRTICLVSRNSRVRPESVRSFLRFAASHFGVHLPVSPG